MSRRPTRSTRTDTPFPFPALFRAAFAEAKPLRLRAGRSTHAGPASALALVSARRGLAAGLFRLGLAALGFARSLLRRLRLLLRSLLLLLAQLVGGDIPRGHLGAVDDDVEQLVLAARRAERGLGLRIGADGHAHRRLLARK